MCPPTNKPTGFFATLRDKTLGACGLRMEDDYVDEDYEHTAAKLNETNPHNTAEDTAGCFHHLGVKLHLKKAYHHYPDEDPFYGYKTTSAELARRKPGSILRWRAIDLTPFPGLDVDHLKAWQIAYVYEDGATRQKAVTVCVVIRPPNAKGNQVLVQLPKTDASIPKCRTSYALRKGGAARFASLSESVFLISNLARGWIVMLPDYEGQHDAFAHGEIVGRASLDAVRATLQFRPVGLKPDTKVVVSGYSSGAHATFWASTLQAEYAPELTDKIIGWAGGGLPIDLKGAAHHMTGGIAAGLIVGVMRGLCNVYPELNAWLDRSVTNKGHRLYEIPKKECFAPFMLASVGKDVIGPEYFKLPKPLEEALPSQILATLNLNRDNLKPPKQPMLIMASLHDEVVPIAQVDNLVNKWAAQGGTIELVRDEASAHIVLSFTGFPHQLDWIQDRFDGKENAAQPMKPVITTVQTSLSLDDDKAKKQLDPEQRRQMQITMNAFKDKPYFF